MVRFLILGAGRCGRRTPTNRDVRDAGREAGRGRCRVPCAVNFFRQFSNRRECILLHLFHPKTKGANRRPSRFFLRTRDDIL